MAFDIQEGGSRSTEFDQPDEQTLAFEMNLDLATAEREVFNILDLVSILGGFQRGLRTILTFILAVITYKNYEKFMVAELFQSTKEKSYSNLKHADETKPE